MNKPLMKKEVLVSVHLKLRKPVYDELSKAAKDERRSVKAQAEVMIAKALATPNAKQRG